MVHHHSLGSTRRLRLDTIYGLDGACAPASRYSTIDGRTTPQTGYALSRKHRKRITPAWGLARDHPGSGADRGSWHRQDAVALHPDHGGQHPYPTAQLAHNLRLKPDTGRHSDADGPKPRAAAPQGRKPFRRGDVSSHLPVPVPGDLPAVLDWAREDPHRLGDIKAVWSNSANFKLTFFADGPIIPQEPAQIGNTA
jgi:hypothetical protein